MAIKSEKRYAINNDYVMFCTEHDDGRYVISVVLVATPLDIEVDRVETYNKNEANAEFKRLVAKWKNQQISWYENGEKWYGFKGGE